MPLTELGKPGQCWRRAPVSLTSVLDTTSSVWGWVLMHRTHHESSELHRGVVVPAGWARPVPTTV